MQTKEKIDKILDVINFSSDLLNQRGIKDARLNVELLMCHVLNCKRLELYLNFDKPLNLSEREAFKKLLVRRIANEPLQYILGETNFYGYKIKVDKRVLIPRQETEILVEEILKEFSKKQIHQINILEIGCGSGCITIALAGELKKLNKNFKILSIDISEGAITLAKENLDLNGLKDVNVKFSQESIFDLKSEIDGIDFLISNPPYISENEFNHLEKEVKNFEPKIALTDNEDGFKFYRSIFNMGKNLKKDSYIFCEISYNGRTEIEKILSLNGFSDYQFIKDLSGIERVLKVKL
ncbi:MAG TPA: peptide chain release factor N(5)-glutamine methyltransferase [Ignavibacteria bacterium]|nr:peptide chain release factor N(5)-glutamine methyltransferase [Ignavibacteria bacterium]